MREQKMVRSLACSVGSWSGDWSGFLQRNSTTEIIGGQVGQVSFYMEIPVSLLVLLLPVPRGQNDLGCMVIVDIQKPVQYDHRLAVALTYDQEQPDQFTNHDPTTSGGNRETHVSVISHLRWGIGEAQG
jgi:hypothetical protein